MEWGEAIQLAMSLCEVAEAAPSVGGTKDRQRELFEKISDVFFQ